MKPYVRIKGWNILNKNYIKRKEKSIMKKNRHLDLTKWQRTKDSIKKTLENSYHRLTKNKRRKKR